MPCIHFMYKKFSLVNVNSIVSLHKWRLCCAVVFRERYTDMAHLCKVCLGF